MRKRYVVKFENVNGKGCLGTFTKLEKAEHMIKINQLSDKNDIMQGYKDLQNRYWIEEVR